ncbi:hypothetical protein Pelo_9625 [Pelomyxa schiedti]|nr:hypothetical protein Pelo_9625 [Pelomyxa schiedti]
MPETPCPLSDPSTPIQDNSPLVNEDIFPFEMDEGELQSSPIPIKSSLPRTGSLPKFHHLIGTRRNVSVDILANLSSSILTVEKTICSIAAVGTGEIWVGLNTGDIMFFRDTSDLSGTLNIHTSAIFCMAMVGNSVICSSEDMNLYGVDVLSHAVAKRGSSLFENDASSTLPSHIQLIMPVHLETSVVLALVLVDAGTTSYAITLDGDKQVAKSQIDGTATCATQHCGTLWFGTVAGLITVFDTHHLTLMRVIRLSSEPVTSIANVWAESCILVAQGSSLISLDVDSGGVVQYFERPEESEMQPWGDAQTPPGSIPGRVMNPSGIKRGGTIDTPGDPQQDQSTNLVAVRTVASFVIALRQDGKLLVWNRTDSKCLQVLTAQRQQPSPGTSTTTLSTSSSSTTPTISEPAAPRSDTATTTAATASSSTASPAPPLPIHKHRPLHTLVVAETAGLVCTNPITLWASVGYGSALLIWR